MATKVIKKLASALDDLDRANDVAGLKSSRYEKLQVSYGYIPAGTISIGDVLSFTDVPSADIIRATVVVHEGTPLTLEIFPGSNISVQQSINIAQLGTGLVTSNISYVIEYIRGNGKVGVSSSSAAALLNNADEDGPETATSGKLNVASGDCLQVLITT